MLEEHFKVGIEVDDVETIASMTTLKIFVAGKFMFGINGMLHACLGGTPYLLSICNVIRSTKMKPVISS